MSKPVLLVSACLMGQPVRYDGGHRLQPWLQALSECFELLPFCPEVMAGLGVPRPPVRLVALGAKVRALGVDDAGLDVTDTLLAVSDNIVAQAREVCGVVLKSKSPSCGLGSTPLVDSKGRELGRTSGVIAQALERALPGYPMADEEMLSGNLGLSLFMAQASSFVRTDSR